MLNDNQKMIFGDEFFQVVAGCCHWASFLESLNFDQAGIVPVVVQNAEDGGVMMIAHADRTAVVLSLGTGEMHYYSRVKKGRWSLSQTGVGRQRLLEIKRDENGETLVASVKQSPLNAIQEAYALQWIVSSEGAIEVAAHKKSAGGA